MPEKKLLIEKCNFQIALSPSLCNKYKTMLEKKSPFIIRGVPATILDEMNANGRIYPKAMMEATIQTLKDRKAFERKELLGVGDDHPADSSYVRPIEASHVVIDAYIKECNGHQVLMNDWLVLNTRNGKDLQELLREGCSVGTSIRGLGSMDENNCITDYEFLSTDCVGEPSAGTHIDICEYKEISLQDNLTESVQLNEADNDSISISCKELLDRLIAFKYDVKSIHWSASSWGQHLSLDKVDEELDDLIDTLAEVQFMSRGQQVSGVLKPEYSANNDYAVLEQRVQDMLDLSNKISKEGNADDAIINYLNGLSQELQRYKGFIELGRKDANSEDSISDGMLESSLKEALMQFEAINSVPLNLFESSIGSISDKMQAINMTMGNQNPAFSKKDFDNLQTSTGLQEFALNGFIHAQEKIWDYIVEYFLTNKKGETLHDLQSKYGVLRETYLKTFKEFQQADKKDASLFTDNIRALMQYSLEIQDALADMNIHVESTHNTYQLYLKKKKYISEHSVGRNVDFMTELDALKASIMEKKSLKEWNKDTLDGDDFILFTKLNDIVGDMAKHTFKLQQECVEKFGKVFSRKDQVLEELKSSKDSNEKKLLTLLSEHWMDVSGLQLTKHRSYSIFSIGCLPRDFSHYYNSLNETVLSKDEFSLLEHKMRSILKECRFPYTIPLNETIQKLSEWYIAERAKLLSATLLPLIHNVFGGKEVLIDCENLFRSKNGDIYLEKIVSKLKSKNALQGDLLKISESFVKLDNILYMLSEARVDNVKSNVEKTNSLDNIEKDSMEKTTEAVNLNAIKRDPTDDINFKELEVRYGTVASQVAKLLINGAKPDSFSLEVRQNILKYAKEVNSELLKFATGLVENPSNPVSAEGNKTDVNTPPAPPAVSEAKDDDKEVIVVDRNLADITSMDEVVTEIPGMERKEGRTIEVKDNFGHAYNYVIQNGLPRLITNEAIKLADNSDDVVISSADGEHKDQYLGTSAEGDLFWTEDIDHALVVKKGQYPDNVKEFLTLQNVQVNDKEVIVEGKDKKVKVVESDDSTKTVDDRLEDYLLDLGLEISDIESVMTQVTSDELSKLEKIDNYTEQAIELYHQEVEKILKRVFELDEIEVADESADESVQEKIEKCKLALKNAIAESKKKKKEENCGGKKGGKKKSVVEGDTCQSVPGDTGEILVFVPKKGGELSLTGKEDEKETDAFLTALLSALVGDGLGEPVTESLIKLASVEKRVIDNDKLLEKCMKVKKKLLNIAMRETKNIKDVAREDESSIKAIKDSLVKAMRVSDEISEKISAKKDENFVQREKVQKERFSMILNTVSEKIAESIDEEFNHCSLALAEAYDLADEANLALRAYKEIANVLFKKLSELQRTESGIVSAPTQTDDSLSRKEI